MTSVHVSASILQRMRTVIVAAVIAAGLLAAPLWINATNAFEVSGGHLTNQLTPVQVAPLVDITPNAKCGGVVAPC
jgi:hypothetical protein